MAMRLCVPRSDVYGCCVWMSFAGRVVAILAAIATVVGAATAWGLWPTGVVVLIGVGLIAALSLLLESHRAEQAAGRQAGIAIDRGEPDYDRSIVQAIRELVPRKS